MDQGVDQGPRGIDEILSDERLNDVMEEIDSRLEVLLTGNANAARILALWRDGSLLTEDERGGLTETFSTPVGDRVWEDVVSYVPKRRDLNSATGQEVINPAQLRIKSQPRENPLEGEGLYLGDNNWENPTIEFRVPGRRTSHNTQAAVDGALGQLSGMESRLLAPR